MITPETTDLKTKLLNTAKVYVQIYQMLHITSDIVPPEDTPHFLHLDTSVACCHIWEETFEVFSNGITLEEHLRELLTILMLISIPNEIKIIFFKHFTTLIAFLQFLLLF